MVADPADCGSPNCGRVAGFCHFITPCAVFISAFLKLSLPKMLHPGCSAVSQLNVWIIEGGMGKAFLPVMASGTTRASPDVSRRKVGIHRDLPMPPEFLAVTKL